MQSDLVSYQRTISCIEYIIHFDTATAVVHHLKAEKVRCEQRGLCPPTCAPLGQLRALSPPAAGVAYVTALVLLSLPFALLVNSILGEGIVRVVGGGKQ